MATAKLFSLNRMARFVDPVFERSSYFVPGDLIGFTDIGDGDIRLHLADGVEFCIKCTIEDLEAEINRALQATQDDKSDFTKRTAEEIKEQIRDIKKEFDKKEEDAFRMNDFYPDLDKDKKGVN